MHIDFIHTLYYGNTLRAWCVALGVVVVGFPLLLSLRGALVRHLGKLTRRTSVVLDDLIMALLQKTPRPSIFTLSVALATLALDLPEATSEGLRVVFTAALILQLGMWCSQAVAFMVGHYGRQQGEAPAKGTLAAMSFMLRLVLWAVVALLLLDNFGVHVTALITTLGVGGIAVALAAQSVLGDLLAAVSIYLDKPVVVGDFIAFDDVFLGTIEGIGLRSTRIRSLSGEQIIVANSDLLKTRIRNYSRMPERRVVFSILLGYGAPYEEVERLPEAIRAAIDAQPKTRVDRSHFKAFNESSLEFETVYYVTDSDYGLYMDTQQRINLRLFRHFEEHGLSFAHPIRAVSIEEPRSKRSSEAPARS